MLNLKDLFKPRLKLKKKLKELNEIPHINHGGCAAVAYGLVEYVKKHRPDKEAKVIFLPDSTEIDDLLNNKATSCLHAIVQIGNKYYDSRGCNTLKYFEKDNGGKHVVLSQELALECVQRKGVWNTWFNRDKHIPRIEKILNIRIPI